MKNQTYHQQKKCGTLNIQSYGLKRNNKLINP